MIHLYTGLPGAGKTNHMVSEITRLLAEGRPCFVANLNGMKIPGAEVLEDPRTWPDLPDGSAVFVDEAQRFWRGGRTSEATPEIHELETHRHRGFDFWLTTQQPTYLNSHLRKLVGEHTHHVRRTSGIAQTWTWKRAADDPVSGSEQELAEGGMYKYDPTAFDKYTSTVEDTHKPKMSWRMRFIIVGGVLILLAMIFGPGLLKKFTLKTGQTAVEGASGGASPQGSHRAAPHKPLTVEEYVQRLQPRLPGAAWSAPVFDGQAVVAKPETYCIEGHPGRDALGKERKGSVTCLSEQGTRVIVPTAIALRIAREGPAYNPYRMPKEENADRREWAESLTGAGGTPAAMPAIAGVPPGVIAEEGEPQAAYGAFRGG